jgi:hypothetical protein
MRWPPHRTDTNDQVPRARSMASGAYPKLQMPVVKLAQQASTEP